MKAFVVHPDSEAMAREFYEATWGRKAHYDPLCPRTTVFFFDNADVDSLAAMAKLQESWRTGKPANVEVRYIDGSGK